jgi:MoaA/NifB/PqqE/SkfB family radical SAM enzyme/protein-L-isoaspartate O-methyltransferase
MQGNQFFDKIAKQPPFTKLHPEIAAFFKDYLSGEKAVRFNDRMVVNTQFPPYPSPAFDRLATNFGLIGEAAAGRLYSVTLAITNRCSFACWHCYNSGRSQVDLSIGVLQNLAAVLDDMGAVMVTLTGGEPLLRDDLEEIAGFFGPGACLLVGTTGDGLTAERARRLQAAGVFGTGISLDSDNEAEHDHLRGRKGAFRIALDALNTSGNAGLYPYIVAMARRELLEPGRFFSFLRFAQDQGALEVHLLEPSLTGNLAGRDDAALNSAARRTIVEYQHRVADDESLPILSSFTYLEGPEAFGCGAGLTHFYIDGSGEVCPCNLVPCSFGNIAEQPLEPILNRMREHFRKPRTACVGRMIAPHVPAGRMPTPPDISDEICGRILPERHSVPRFFAVRSAAKGEVGPEELRSAYDSIHSHYNDFWLVEAGKPVKELVEAIRWTGEERVFEAGCGTGYATAMLARNARTVVAADISPGMIEEAERRLLSARIKNVRFIVADALEALKADGLFDVVFSSWVLGYIPLRPFFSRASASLSPGGCLAVVVHRENSPREPLEIFSELVAREPAILQKRVAFDFPAGEAQLRHELVASGFEPVKIWEEAVVFRYESASEVLEHLLKSGAGTAFYEALNPARRDSLTAEFLERLTKRNGGRDTYEVVHDYVACVARRPVPLCLPILTAPG